MGVQHGKKFPIRLAFPRRWEKMTEVQEQTQSVKLGQAAADIIPLFYELRALRIRPQRALQSCRRVIVEAQVSRGELFIENGHTRKQRHRSALGGVRRAQPDLPIAFQGHARYSTSE